MVAIEALVKDKVTPFLERWGRMNVHQLWKGIREESGEYEPRGPGTAMFTTLTLFMLLPNLRELCLHPSWPSEQLGMDPVNYWHYLMDECIRWEQVTDLLYALVSYAKFSGEVSPFPLFLGRTAEYRPLAKLETLVPYNTEGPEKCTPLKDLEPFLALPNLRNVYSISGVIPGGEEYVNGFRWTEEPELVHEHGPWPDPPLRRLEIAYGNCTPEGMEILLGQCQHLEVFKYKHQSKNVGLRGGLGNSWDANEFVKVVGRSTLFLKEFALRVMGGDDMMIGAIRGFEDFHALEELEIDAHLFVDEIRPNKPAGSLADMLPSSIRKVLLNVEWDGELLVSPLVGGLDEVRKGRLRQLEKVVVCAEKADESDEERKKVRELAEAEGVIWKNLNYE